MVTSKMHKSKSILLTVLVLVLVVAVAQLVGFVSFVAIHSALQEMDLKIC